VNALMVLHCARDTGLCSGRMIENNFYG
jgi:hypothetical protein